MTKNKRRHIVEFLQSVMCFHLLYCALFIPFPFYFLSVQKKNAQFLFESIVSFVSESIFNITLINKEITSDSVGMYVLVFILFGLAILTALIFVFIKNKDAYKEQFFIFTNTLFAYYLSLQLFNYGFDKLFKAQFYLPEPNILYTPLGQVGKDLLFWSSMGTSYSYNIFMGMLEIIPALLLLFRKTRILGLLVAVPVLMNIVAINFGFDISVKIYSIFLLWLSLYLLLPYFKDVVLFFILKEQVQLKKDKIFLEGKIFYKTSLKVFAIGLIFLETLFPYLMSGNFNDDNIKRLYLHGAYEVQKVFEHNELIHKESLHLKRIFVHRKGYLIFQDKENEMQDFHLEIKRNKQQLILTDYELNQRKINFEYSEKDSILGIQYFEKGKEYWLETKALDWRKLPALQNDFHWSIEAIK